MRPRPGVQGAMERVWSDGWRSIDSGRSFTPACSPGASSLVSSACASRMGATAARTSPSRPTSRLARLLYARINCLRFPIYQGKDKQFSTAFNFGVSSQGTHVDLKASR